MSSGRGGVSGAGNSASALRSVTVGRPRISSSSAVNSAASWISSDTK
jgi:hypothetical protein